MAIQTGWSLDYIMSLEKSLLHELYVFCEFIEPIGSLEDSQRIGQLASLIGTLKSNKKFKPSDFFPELENISLKQREDKQRDRIKNGIDWLFHGTD